MGDHGVFDRLEAEYAAFDRTLVALDPHGWSDGTLCEGWDVRDLVCHLWLQSEAAWAGAGDGPSPLEGFPSDPARFDAWIDEAVRRNRDVDGPEVWRRWRDRRADAVARLRARPEDRRVRWTFGALTPTMLGTVLAMETWAHHLDVRSPQGLPDVPSAAMRDVAFLAWKTLPWAFSYAGERPRVVRFELDAPDGERWRYGPPDAEGVVEGDAGELCLVAVRRLAPEDARTLTATGEAGELALRVVRCFA